MRPLLADFNSRGPGRFPGKRKVGGSTPPLTTRSDQMERYLALQLPTTLVVGGSLSRLPIR